MYPAANRVGWKDLLMTVSGAKRPAVGPAVEVVDHRRGILHVHVDRVAEDGQLGGGHQQHEEERARVSQNVAGLLVHDGNEAFKHTTNRFVVGPLFGVDAGVNRVA